MRLDKKQVGAQFGNKIIVLPNDVGALTPEGTLDGDYPAPKSGDKPATTNDVADEASGGKGNRPRIRIWSDDPAFDAKSDRMRLILRIDFPLPEDEDGAGRAWHWFERPVPTDNSKNAVHPVLLTGHVDDVANRANEIVSNLPLDEWIKNAVLVAAQFHDLGKQRDLWQRSIGRPDRLADIWFGKSGKLGGRRWRARDVTEYRHEFGSVVDLQLVPAFQALDDDARDLVQQLIASHHGQARPHFTAKQIIDPDSTTPAADEALAIEVPRRFARLQRRFGRWGLAYLESLLRAADWHASANPISGIFTEDAR